MKPGTSPLLPTARDWWLLPSGRTVSIRRIECIDSETECAVRYIDEHGALSQGEFHLTVAYVVRGRRVGHD